MKNMRIATLHSLEKDLAQGTMKDVQDLKRRRVEPPSGRRNPKTKGNCKRCLPIRKHRGAREKRYSFGYAVFLILALMK